MDERRFSITVRDLYVDLYPDHAPMVVDLQSTRGVRCGRTTLAGAIRRFPAGAEGWIDVFARLGPVGASSVRGNEVGQGVAANYAHDDHAMLAHAMTIYDAFYVSCREARRRTVDLVASK